MPVIKATIEPFHSILIVLFLVFENLEVAVPLLLFFSLQIDDMIGRFNKSIEKGHTYHRVSVVGIDN